MSGTATKLTGRWMIEGTITAKSRFYTGSGLTTKRPGLVNEKTKSPVEIVATAVDLSEHPYVPGSSLKGNLRSYAVSEFDALITERLFGSDDPSASSSVGSAAEFFDAYRAESPNLNIRVPYWSETRLTGVAASTQIGRRTKTVSENKLFHFEFAPEGTVFRLRIGGTVFDKDDRDADIRFVLGVLAGFNNGRVCLGAENANGWGRFAWSLDTVKVLDDEAVRRWKADGCRAVGWEILRPHPDQASLMPVAPADAGSKDTLVVEIKLPFSGNFLVNDSSATGKGADMNDHAPLTDRKGKALLPARSFRGAFRSQAERILRTIGGDGAACHPGEDGRLPGCSAVHSEHKLGELCPACRMFGAPGWKSPFEFSDFISYRDGKQFVQQFVAIDRFTGGSAQSAKFDARSVLKPALAGTVRIDLEALQRAGCLHEAFGLLALALRDLKEGDITFGFGSAKGYGRVEAEISLVSKVGTAHSAFSNELAEFLGGGTGKFPEIVSCVEALESMARYGRPVER